MKQVVYQTDKKSEIHVDIDLPLYKVAWLNLAYSSPPNYNIRQGQLQPWTAEFVLHRLPL